MGELTEKFETDVFNDKLVFETHCNGDKLTIAKMALTQEMATSLAWIINHPSKTTLKLVIKVKD